MRSVVRGLTGSPINFSPQTNYILVVNEHEYASFEKLSDRELFDFVTEKDNSQRKWVAMHLLELRRNQALVRAARSSAVAAWIAAIVAGASMVITFIASKAAGS